TNYDTPGTYTFTVPTGVTQLTIEAWGGGGGGGGEGSQFGAAGGGGGAGGYAKGVVSVTPLQRYNIQVGAVGAHGAPDQVGGTGGPTIFGMNLFRCVGGTGGQPGNFN